MNIVCLDMEGVLVPEIWIAFAEESGIPELRRTTRDEPDYDKLMRWRIDLLRQRGLKLSAIQETISRIDPLPGAKDFLDALRKDTQVVILSDTFDQFAMMEQLHALTGMDIPKNLRGLEGRPVLHTDVIDKDAMLDYVLSDVLK